DRVVERLDAEAVARAEKTALRLIPDREGEHAAELVDTRRSPLAVRAEDDLRVRRRPKLTLADLSAELEVVVDLAVVGDPVAAFVPHRLVARRQVDDLESPMCEANVPRWVNSQPFSIWPALTDQRG